MKSFEVWTSAHHKVDEYRLLSNSGYLGRLTVDANLRFIFSKPLVSHRGSVGVIVKATEGLLLNRIAVAGVGWDLLHSYQLAATGFTFKDM